MLDRCTRQSSTSQNRTPPECSQQWTSRQPSKTSHSEPCCTTFSNLIQNLQQSFPNGTREPQNTGCTVIRPVVSQMILNRYSEVCWVTSADDLTQAPSSLHIWTTGTCGSSHNASWTCFILWAQRPGQSTWSCKSLKTKSGEGPAKTQENVKLTLSCLGGHLQIQGDIEPSPIVLGEPATMEKTTQRFQRIAGTLADLNADGLNAQTVNDLLSLYVGAANQHVPRMSFVSEQEARDLDAQVVAFWSTLIKRDVISPLFFLPLKMGGLGVGSAVQRHAAAPWLAWRTVIPSLMRLMQAPDIDTFLNSTPQLRTQFVQLQTAISQQMNKPALPPQTTWSCSSPEGNSEKAGHHHPRTFPQTFTTDEQASLPP